jgi:hypothetical protein
VGRIEKTVFVSYRRTDESWGLAIFQDLTQHGYDVFIDYDGIASGNFETAILENIKARAHFLVLLTPTALDRCGDPTDWMRREIEAALDNQRNIVPLMLAGFDFSKAAIAGQLTGKLAALKEYNGLEIPKAKFFSSEMERLRNKFLNVEVDAVLRPASDSAQRIAKEQKDKAAMALGSEQRKRSKVRPWLIGGGTVGIAAVIALWVLQLPRTPIDQPPLVAQAPVTQSPPPTSSEQPAQAPVTQSPPPTSSEQPAQAPAATQPTSTPSYIFLRQVRCETRQAIIENAVGWLTSKQNQIEGKVDPASRAIGIGFMNGRPIQEFSPKLFKGRTHDIVAAIYDFGVAYTFTLFTKGGLDRKREGERLFTGSDSFSGLIHLPDDYCMDPVGNYNYVVPEKFIGVKRLVQEFIELSLFGNVRDTKGPPTLVNQLSGSKDFHYEVTLGLAIGGEQNAVAAVNQFLTLKARQ